MAPPLRNLSPPTPTPMPQHPRPPSSYSPPLPPAPALADRDAGFDPVEEYLLDDFDYDQAMASEHHFWSRRRDGFRCDGSDGRRCRGPCLQDDGSVFGSGGVKVEEKGGLLGPIGSPRGVELDVKKEAVMLSGRLGGDLGPDHQLPVLGISNLIAEEDSVEGVIDAEMGTVAAVDAEMCTVASVDAAEMSYVAAAHADTSIVADSDADMSTVAALRADTSTVAQVNV